METKVNFCRTCQKWIDEAEASNYHQSHNIEWNALKPDGSMNIPAHWLQPDDEPAERD